MPQTGAARRRALWHEIESRRAAADAELRALRALTGRSEREIDDDLTAPDPRFESPCDDCLMRHDCARAGRVTRCPHDQAIDDWREVQDRRHAARNGTL